MSKRSGIASIVEEWKLRGRPWQLGTDWDPKPWIEAFPEYKEFILEQKKYNLGILDRDLVKQVVQLCCAEGEFLEAFLIVMIWGYSGNSVGPFRTRRVLNELGVKERLEKVFELLQDDTSESRINSIRQAFEIITQEINYLGTSFGTKFLYFAGSNILKYDGEAPTLKPEIVILDKRVATAWKYWLGSEIELHTLNGTDYCRFLEQMSEIAETLEITPEELEFVLFCNPGDGTSDSNWASLQTFNEVTDFETLVWGLAFASELMLNNSRLFPLWTRPGGGQYNCVSVYCELNSQIHFDFNLDGRLHAFLDDHYVTDWNTLIRKGAYSSALFYAQNPALPEETDNAFTPWAVSLRALVSMLITDSQLKDAIITPFVVDNSAYGLQSNSSLITKYETNLSSISRPTPLGLPPEIWLYEIVTTEGRSGLIDLFECSITWDMGRREDLIWPR